MEYVEETQIQQELNVMQCILDYYNKGLMMLINDVTSHIFQESKQESTFEKVVSFIPKMIRKLIDFIKSKLKKLFNKDIPDATDNVRELINDHKKNKNKSKIAIAAAAVGCTAAVGVSGFILYNKQKHKVIEIISNDDSEKVEVIIPFDLEKVSKFLDESSKVSKMYFDHSYNGQNGRKSDYKKMEEELNLLIKELKEFNDAQSSPNTEPRKMTLQQLQQTLQHLIDNNVDADWHIKLSRDESPVTTDTTVADRLKQEFANFSGEFGKFSANITNEINVIHQTLLTLINSTGEKEFISFDYVDKLVTYCSYRSSKGFRIGLINAPSADKPSPEDILQSSTRAFNVKENVVYNVIEKVLTQAMFSHPVWGIINGTKFAKTPYIITGDCDKYETYVIIFKSTADEQFKRFVSFINTTSVETTKALTKDVMVINHNKDNEDGGLQGFKMFPFSKFMAATQKSSPNIAKALIPNDNEIICRVESYNEELIRDVFKRVPAFNNRNIYITPIRGISNMVKITFSEK